MKNLMFKIQPDIKKVLLLLVIVISLYFCSAGQCFAQLKTGETAPDFTFADLNGKEYQLSQFKSKQDFILLSFLRADDTNSIGKFEDIIAFFSDCKPVSSYQIIGVLVPPEDGSEDYRDNFSKYLDIQGIPLTILVADDTEVLKKYNIESFPTVLLLRYNLSINKIYSKFSTREERSFYQYLNFSLQCQPKNNKDSSGCNNGVCPPPPGFE